MPLQVTLFYVDAKAKPKVLQEITMFSVDAREALHNGPSEYFQTLEEASAACAPPLKVKGGGKGPDVKDPQDPAPQDPAPQDPAPQGPAPQDPAPQE
ncbi:MAG: hypothetical protein ACRCTG_15470 [Aestuariivirga sp.]